MNCDRARRTLYDNPGVVERSLLCLHLLRCPACRAEAHQIRALDAALTDLPRFGPPPELLGRVLAQARTLTRTTKTRKGSRTMRRVAFALASLIVIGILSAGLLMKPGRTDGRALLISAAQAMEQVETVHARVFGSIAGYYPSMRINDDYDEYWFSPDGFRRDSYHEDGTLWRRLAGNVAQGIVWMDLPTLSTRPGGVCATGGGGAGGGGAGGGAMVSGDLPTTGVSIEYEVGPSDLAAFVEQRRKQFVDADLRLAHMKELGHEWTTSEQERDGRPVIVIEEDLGLNLVAGTPRGTVEYYIAPSTNRLVALEQYGPEEDGHLLLAEIEDIEYGLEIPTSIFTPAIPRPEQVVQGTFEVPDEGYIVFHGMGYAPPLDPRATTLFDRAQEVRHWVTMSVLPWDDLENAYLAVLQQDPDHYGAREYLGRFYTRWGKHEEALAVLPEVERGWSALNRAFCYDALGQRDKALQLYGKLKDVPHDSIAQWARLGLKQPTWPSDLPIAPEPGEFRLSPRASWSVTASHSAFHGEPNYALDGDRATRWAGPGQQPDEWFLLDFGPPLSLSRVVLDHHGIYTIYTNDWPRGLRAFATADGEAWSPVAVSPAGPNQPATVRFDPPQLVKALRFELTRYHSPEWWSVHEIFVFGSSR